MRASVWVHQRGTASLAILRAQDLVRELDAEDREYLAPYAAELLVDLSTDVARVEVMSR